ncbi:chaplin [Streptomyces lydicus]|uniref:chaplin n=1 Tax=Streptomyces lydicus TaxID=47763 RepID=UPI000525F8EC|nr:chaplin [Streptomyces lydicus]MDC7338867.1 chaplin [Streptomyces lydicus]UEG91648.1 chaplin [Streptomyces lydicus]
MKRFIKTAAIAAASCTLVVSGAGIASASGDGHHGGNRGDHGRNGHHGRHHHGDYRSDFGYRSFYGHRGGANAAGFAAGSPGVLSGNVIQVPINIPINVCGNSINVAALLNPAFGNVCINR